MPSFLGMVNLLKYQRELANVNRAIGIIGAGAVELPILYSFINYSKKM